MHDQEEVECISRKKGEKSQNLHSDRLNEEKVFITLTSDTTRYTKNKGWSLYPTNSITGERFSSFSFTCFSFRVLLFETTSHLCPCSVVFPSLLLLNSHEALTCVQLPSRKWAPLIIAMCRSLEVTKSFYMRKKRPFKNNLCGNMPLAGPGTEKSFASLKTEERPLKVLETLL